MILLNSRSLVLVKLMLLGNLWGLGAVGGGAQVLTCSQLHKVEEVERVLLLLGFLSFGEGSEEELPSVFCSDNFSAIRSGVGME